ncbi:MAG: ATP-binding protein [Bacteroidales bacterium]|nr:ATP-binding protein [Lachnoclostridium sp.]MCM1383620.1 ATP-binding protein [Lachnoclostridium sp.]MCM1465702.1 ATP-binding protein [Bacteroidales bacterium]
MGFFQQNQQEEKGRERLVLLLYSVYSLSMAVSAVRRGWEWWIPVLMAAALLMGWAVCISGYRTARARAGITTALIQFTVILYAAHMEDIVSVIPAFMVLTVLAALYGITELVGFSVAGVLCILFYHLIIADTFSGLSKEAVSGLLFQAGNLICLEFIIYFWLKKRNENMDRIYQIIDALMDAEQSKDDFLSNVSHEIRTPVNTICGMSEIALREQDLDKMREEVFDIRDAGNNLMSLVSDILDFSQLQQGNMPLEEEAYNITSTMNDIINMAMARKGDKPIELIVDCDANIPCSLLGDEKKIRRVIMNLLDNAIKFTTEGGIIVSVSFRRENYGINLCVSVKDTGIGISEKNMEKLFESFSQVDTRRNRQEGGVGLGLAISKALVQKMGGTITFRSRLGKGSIFRFVVPQKVLDDSPMGYVENREKLNIAAYFDMEQFDMRTIRDEYSGLILHMVQQLQVKCHVCRNLAELKRRGEYDSFTHVFISLEEYQEDETYFDELAKKAEVIMVIDRPREKYVNNPDIIRLYKPFYILPVIAILNGSRITAGGMQLVRQGKFTAPQAHVLVVDDNRMNIRVIEGMLKEYQIKVSYALSGPEALKLIEDMCYDFVFMDHMMPEMDGIETLHHIREKSGNYYKRVPIIALTANAAPGNREMFLEEGFNDFVAKPMEMSVLERVLRRNLPEEKLVFHTPKDMAHESKKETEKAQTGELVIGELDVEKGLLYCGGKEAYLRVLNACLTEGEEEIGFLNRLYEQKDWKNYIIKVHALKSTMQNIGATVLSGKAKELELAGKRGDTAYILGNHEDLLKEHRRLIQMLRECPLLFAETGRGETESLPEGDLQDLDEKTFDRLLSELEDAMYALRGEEMLTIVSKLQECRYNQTALREMFEPVKRKIEMSDYMSAVDMAARIREKL